MARYINHAGHPHPLRLREGTKATFRCALCRCRGYGTMYSCLTCDFRVHDTCAARPPETLSFFGHPQHPLALYPLDDHADGRNCDLCNYCIQGLHYGCRLCGVYLHPVCATLPPSSISPVHPQHLLTLVPSTAGGKCASASCRERLEVVVWHYVCAPCGVRLHPWCLLGDRGDDDEEEKEAAPLCIRGV